MLKLQKFDVYEYPLKDDRNHKYYGSYTIKHGLTPCGYKNEKLIQTFETYVKA